MWASGLQKKKAIDKKWGQQYSIIQHSPLGGLQVRVRRSVQVDDKNAETVEAGRLGTCETALKCTAPW